MTATAAQDKDIRELQRLAQSAPVATARPLKKQASRAARLEAIDLLSRWSAAGLAAIAGVGVYLAVTLGATYPARAAAWAFMLLCALWVCRRMQSQFRTGAAIAAKPFRWRASFSACLCVLGVAFASAPILLTPSTAPPADLVQAALLTFAGAFGAAVFFSVHLKSAAAIAVPGAAFPILSALRNGDLTTALLTAAAALIGTAGLVAINHLLTSRMKRRRPRTAALRNDFAIAEDEAEGGEDLRQQSA